MTNQKQPGESRKQNSKDTWAKIRFKFVCEYANQVYNLVLQSEIEWVRMDNEKPEGRSKTESRQSKQLYLREQILDAGYDPQEFVKYLNVRLAIDSDLQKCSLASLEEVVAQFRTQKQQQIEEANNYFRETMQVEPTICQKQSSGSEPCKVTVKCNPEVVEDEFISTFKCVKVTDKYEKLKGQITCEVNNPSRKYMGGIMGIGGTSYLCFDVWSYGFSKDCVSRRYSDFVWLRTVLLKFYPSEIIPPIPNKKASKRLPRQIRKRMRVLTLFLNDVVKMPVLLNNKYVEGFLLIKDHDQFESLKEEGEKKKSYESMLSTETLTGKVDAELSNRTIKYKDGLRRFVPEAQVLYKEITRNSKKMKALTTQKINLLYEMGNQFAELYSITGKFNAFVTNEATDRLNQIYAMLNNMMVEWGNSLKKEIQDVEKNLCTFFKYVREEFMGFREILDRTQACEDAWIRDKDAVEKQKQKIFQLRDAKKWNLARKDLEQVPTSAIYDRAQAFRIMLPKQSVQVQQLKQNYAYYLSQLHRHGNENFLRCADKFCDNFREFSIKAKVNNQEIGAMWTEISYRFSDPYNRHPVIQKMEMENQDESEGQISGAYDD